ncbi:hypothetical protein [Spirosoma montaniterrae]|uniref:HD domain-containing protein n=1 Tax=Spirosoma montaniterrae TaxID=1178516 RepID=A0A1P9WU94_9BACT|nr:hypothetical protein [Spirosoma montaniterrae]AQG78951.1 hypothetical protein AWR27_06195 [Spirosoma montaniterrae]
MNTASAWQHILHRLTIGLDPEQTYHTVGNTIDVAEQVHQIAQAEGITDTEELNLLQIAAYYHDADKIL